MAIRSVGKCLSVLAVTACFTAASKATAGPPLLYEFRGGPAADSLGRSVDNAGDVNGDGFDDIVAGATAHSSGSEPQPYARVYSGADGSVLHQFNAPPGFHSFGQAVVGLGDLDGDGFDDVAVGAPGRIPGDPVAGNVTIFSGQDGSIIDKIFGYDGVSLGSSLARAGDLDGDAVDDLIAGAIGASEPGAVRVYSGSNRSLLYAFIASQVGENVGEWVAGGGDVDGDGIPDILAGASGVDAGAQNTGAAFAFSGADGSLLLSLFGEGENAKLGNPDFVGDLDGDGADDVGVIYTTNPGTSDFHHIARIVSGATGAVLFEYADLYLDSNNSRVRGPKTIRGIGDVNEDGVPDLLAGGIVYSGSSREFVRIVSGAGLSPLGSIAGPTDDTGASFGCYRSALADVNSDGFPDFVIGAPSALGGIQPAGAVYVHDGGFFARCKDLDEDGYGEPASADCSFPERDCDDTRPDAYPGAWEWCNGLDDDCDGTADETYGLLGAPCTLGHGACRASGVYVCGNIETEMCDAVPGVPSGEICNQIDDDCDRQTDEDFPELGEPCTVGVGACAAEGTFICVDNGLGTICDAEAGAPTTETCNGLDDDCDGEIDEDFDADDDGFATCGGDCDDRNALVHPGMVEVCDMADNDCDGEIDEGFDFDGDGFTGCGGDCNDGDPKIYPGAPEIPNDGIDQACDGFVLDCGSANEPGGPIGLWAYALIAIVLAERRIVRRVHRG